MEMSVFVTNMASMIGIGVAVDYSLFIVARYREEIARRAHARTTRAAVALATSGLAVLFSGLTVIVSLAGLWMVDNTAIRSMALGAMLVVARRDARRDRRCCRRCSDAAARVRARWTAARRRRSARAQRPAASGSAGPTA